MSALTSDAVLREPTIYDLHAGTWLGGWPDGNDPHPEDVIDHLKAELLAAREALRRVVGVFDAYECEELPEFAGEGALCRACLPEVVAPDATD